MTDQEHEPSQERLDELQQDIDAARRKAEEDGTLPNPDHEPTFVDPDGDGEADGGAPAA